MSRIAQVCLPHTAHDYYDYLTQGVIPKIGARVWVPFRKQQRLLGIVVGHSESSHYEEKLKKINEVIDADPILSLMMLEFYRWLSAYYQVPLSYVMKLGLPKQMREGRVGSHAAYALENIKMGAAPLLHEAQAYSVETVSQSFGKYQCFLLQGVTGSGKTEVYLQLISQVIAQGKQALVLVPEIGLTPQLLSRFHERLNVPMAVVHSHLSDTERQQAWQAAAVKDAPLVIGTRSALFTPLPELGLIVIDEEHDASFKQQEGVRYSARDAALVRARLAKVPVVLGSATPSLESYHHAQSGKYQHLKLNQKAHVSPPLQFELVDLRAQPMVEGLTERTYRAIETHLKQGNQVLVFINRRGFAPVRLCHQCGWIANCSACDSHMTVHQQDGLLKCHHCGRQTKLQLRCGVCQSQELISVGIGTQRLYQALAKRFPKTAIARVDRDEVKRKRALEQALSAIESGETQLVVGTQMLAKGHHFPKLTLVVIVDADSGFYNQDFRAVERLGQLILQVSGRAGREALPGEVLIQTHLPDHPLLKVLIQAGYDAFAQEILKLRQAASLPPYTFWALIRAKARQEEAVSVHLSEMKQFLSGRGIKVLGPAPALLARKAKFHHMQLCLQSTTRQQLHDALTDLRRMVALNKQKSKVQWSIDVDPIEV